MKQWIRTLPAKIICFILCVTGLVLTAASVIGAILLINSNVYTQTKEYAIEEEVYSAFRVDAYDIASLVVEEKIVDMDRTAFSAANTNLRFQIWDANGMIVARNTEETLTAENYQWKYTRFFSITTQGHYSYLNDFGTETMPAEGNFYTIRAYLIEDLPVSDEYAFKSDVIHVVYALRYAVYVIGILALALTIVCFILLMCVSARKPHSEEVHPGPLHRIPTDLLLAGTVMAYAVTTALLYITFQHNSMWPAIVIALVLVALHLLLGLCMSIAARIKQRTLLKNTVIWMCCKLFWRILKGIGRFFLQIPLVWRTLLIVVVLTVIELIVFANSYSISGLMDFWLVEKIILVPIILYVAFVLRKLQQGGVALAKGDLNYKVNTKMLFWDFKRHGENLNSIAEGMSIAVEEQLKSERMKTELITNVSHDIKTPLTSIINYAGLIAEESCATEHHKEYAEVLVRKSEHLKRLLDDLVEVSKASSGNLEVDLYSCDAGVLLTQVAGEFEQRCQEANLELITKQPEEPVAIMADSRRIWRVFENLMHNACKYSLPGSRVYLSLEKINQEAVFTFRNTSRVALNISPEELMERFVRGDAARSTEGNGLGLSIARSLTELQNGQMDITIDGDLFKVALRFPVV